MLDFRKAEVGVAINFEKDFGEPVKGIVSFNLNWGKIGNRSVDLDAVAVLECRGGLTPIAPRKPDGFGSKLKKFMGLKIDETVELSNTRTRTETVSYKRLEAQGVVHHGDDLTGAWAKGEYIEIDLRRINPNVDTITFSVLSFSGHKFSDLPFASIEVFSGSPQRPIKGLISHELTRFQGNTRTVIMAQLTRNADREWELTAKAIESTASSVEAITTLSKGH